MRNLLFCISYRGTSYHGSQFQKNALSIMDVFQSAYLKVLGEKGELKACSRTDAGVHANMFCISSKTEKTIGCINFVRALNTVLPDDIAVNSCEEVSEEFHARYSAKGKRYIYKIWNSEVKNPFIFDLSHRHRYKMDVEMLDKECKDFIGKHDFRAFCGSKTSVEDTTRQIYACDVVREGDMVVFSVEGNGFLYNMVRIMVGTVIAISDGRIPQGSIPKIIESKDRKKAGMTAPASGLYLDKVFY